MAFTESTVVVVPDISIHVEHGKTTETKKTFRQAQGVRRQNRLIHVGSFGKSSCPTISLQDVRVKRLLHLLSPP